MKDDPTRLAIHEAAHAVVAIALGRGLSGPVSIRPGKHFSGIAFVDAPTLTAVPLLGAPVILLDPDLRKMVETEIVIHLAGPEAERFLFEKPRSSRRPVLPDEQAAERLARVLVLSPSESARLREAEDSDEPRRSDEDWAHELAWALAGSNEVAHYLAWLREVTRHLLLSPSVARSVLAVADELAKHEVLPASAVKEMS